MEDKEIQGLIQECFESLERRTDLEFSYQWFSTEKKLTKTEVMVTLAETSDGRHSGGKAGLSTKTSFGTHWICLFRKELRKMAENDYFENDLKKAVKNVCIHEVLHILDKIKNGKDTKTEKEIIRLSIYYMDNNLPLEI